MYESRTVKAGLSFKKKNLLPTGRFPTTRCAEILPFGFTGAETGTEALLQADVKFSLKSDSEKE